MLPNHQIGAVSTSGNQENALRAVGIITPFPLQLLNKGENLGQRLD
jgi:hypothetical protein